MKTGLVLTSAAIAGAAAMGFASQASAADTNPTGQYIKLLSATMDQNYTANVGISGHAVVDAYSNGVTFQYQNATNAAGTVTNNTVYTLFGFCVDIAHDMYINTTLNYVYQDNYVQPPGSPPPGFDPLPNDFNSPTADPISPTTLSALDKLIDTGWLLHESEAGKSQDYVNNVELQLAAIQAAIWYVEGGPTHLTSVTLNNGSSATHTVANSNVLTANYGGAVAGANSLTYQGYFNAYSTGAFTDLGDHNDTFYTIVQVNPYDGHQSFAIGWPLPGVPEPTTWALMLVGFGGLGAMLRLRRKQALVTA